MKFLSLLITFIFIIFLNNVNAEQKIVFFDMDRIVSTSTPGSSLLKQLKDISDKNLILLNKKEKSFKEKETKLISQKNIITESEFINKVDLLKKEINEQNKNRIKLIDDFNKLKIKNINKFLKSINIILAKYSNDNAISLILQKKNLVIGVTELDITDDILKIVNNDIKEFKIK